MICWYSDGYKMSKKLVSKLFPWVGTTFWLVCHFRREVFWGWKLWLVIKLIIELLFHNQSYYSIDRAHIWENAYQLRNKARNIALYNSTSISRGSWIEEGKTVVVLVSRFYFLDVLGLSLQIVLITHFPSSSWLDDDVLFSADL